MMKDHDLMIAPDRTVRWQSMTAVLVVTLLWADPAPADKPPWAGGGAGGTGPLQQCTSDLQECGNDLFQCEGDLGSCDDALSTCNGNLDSCDDALDSCESDLGACQAATCGNGIAEFGEACDGANLQGETCASQGFTYGELACRTDCTLDTTACSDARFVDNGDGTVSDHATGLMWEKKTDDGSVHDKDAFFSWSSTADGNDTNPDGTAFTVFLAALNDCRTPDGTIVQGGLGGHCDWRLPQVDELRTILDGTQGVPAVDQTIFGPTFPSDHWTGTTVDTNPPFTAMAVSFAFGFAADFAKDSAFPVRAVRGPR